MTLRQLKQYLDNLPDAELDKNLGYKSKYSSGTVIEIKKAEEDLYYMGDDDPSELYTREQLEYDGYDDDEINSMIVEIHKNDYLFEF